MIGRKKTELDHHTEQSTENERNFRTKNDSHLHIKHRAECSTYSLHRSNVYVRMDVCACVYDLSNNLKMLQIDCLRSADNFARSLFFPISFVFIRCSFVPSLFHFIDETNLFLN